MHEMNFKEQITLKIATGEYEGGLDVYDRLITKAIISTLSSRDVEIWGNVNLSKVFIVDVKDRVLSLPLEIIYNENTYTAKQIQECRSVNGTLEAHRIFT